MQVSYKVLNVKCGGCATSIQNNLSKIEGIREISIDVPSGTVEISGENFDETIIKDTLTQIGYPIDDTDSLLAKAKHLLNK